MEAGGGACGTAVHAGRGVVMKAIPIINMERSGENIKRLMDNAHMTVRDIQTIFGFSTPNAIYKWIHGTSLPTLDNILVLSDILSVPIEQILVVGRGE